VPFKKVGKNTYQSPSGRTYSGKQVRAYYTTAGFKRKPQRKKAK
jgi:hypothetical protein